MWREIREINGSKDFYTRSSPLKDKEAECLRAKEKKGGPVRTVGSCMDFKQMLNASGLWEIKHSGYQFSWFGLRHDQLIQCRLDRTVANQAWSEMFPQAQATYLLKNSFDHSPLINNLIGERGYRRAGFKYDKRWMLREGFKQTMENFWRKETNPVGRSLVEIVAECRKEISVWKRRNQPNSAKRIQELQIRIDAATRREPFRTQELHSLKTELNNEYRLEEEFWKQKSRET